MQRNPEIFRDILLLMEKEHQDTASSFELTSETFADYDFQAVCHHVFLLIDSGYLLGLEADLDEQLFVRRMTESGHLFLDTIRDAEIWNATKKGAASVGSWSLELLSELAKGFFKTKVKKHTGVEI